MEQQNYKPTLTVLVGLPASGKSTYAKNICLQDDNSITLSSDDLREELLGDRQDQNDNTKVFNRLYLQMQSNLLIFKNVIIDATNISRKSRKQVFERIRNIPCHVKAIVFATPFDECISRNDKREYSVPESVINRMYRNFEFPQKFEGFDEIEVINELTFNQREQGWCKLFEGTINYDQMTPFHTLTLGEHLCKCGNNLITNNIPLFCATYWHDIGKPIVAQWNEEKQRKTYYKHENVGTYEIMVYCNDIINKDVLFDTLFYINYHMLPYSLKEQKTIDKYRNLFGDRLFNNLMLLHEADKKAH